MSKECEMATPYEPDTDTLIELLRSANVTMA